MALGLANVKLYVLTGSTCILFPFKATKFHSPNRFCFMIPLKCSKRRYKKTFQSIGLFKIGTLFHIEWQISRTILVKKSYHWLVCIVIRKEEKWCPLNLFSFLYIYLSWICVFAACQTPLGMQSGAIPDSSLSASSFKDNLHKPVNARPSQSVGWCSKVTFALDRFL